MRGAAPYSLEIIGAVRIASNAPPGTLRSSTKPHSLTALSVKLLGSYPAKVVRADTVSVQAADALEALIITDGLTG